MVLKSIITVINNSITLNINNMKYCSNCGSGNLAFRVPEKDSLPRYVCDKCQVIHYQNPKLVVGCIPELDGEVLLCRRAIEPRYGYWTLPAGFMENGESIEDGAARETKEEANAVINKPLQLFSIYSIPAINQVHLFFKAALKDNNFYPGIESLEVKLFNKKTIPWDELAFATVRKTLHNYYDDDDNKGIQRDNVHIGTIKMSPR